MIKHLAPFITVQARTPDEQRRGQILVTLSLGVVVILLTIGIVLTLFQPTPGRFINLGLATLVFATAAWLGRKGFVTAGSYVLIVVSGIGALSGMFLNPNSHFNIFYLLLSVLLASVLLRPHQIWVVLGLALAALGGVVISLPSSQRAMIALDLAAAHVTVLLTVSALITFIGARSLATALDEARELRQQAEAANRRLAELNADLERRVAERTAALEQLTVEQQATMAQLQAALAAQQQLNQQIINLSAPMIPINDETLVTPIIGQLDQTRIQQLLQAALTAIEQTNARVLVIDVTGVAIIDTHAAAGLLQVAQAARLMGAVTVLAGIRPEVAQTLVSLGADLSAIRTAATLQAALAMRS